MGVWETCQCGRFLLHAEVEIIRGEERGGVLKNGIAAFGDFRGLVN